MYIYTQDLEKFKITCYNCGSGNLEMHVDSYDTGGCPSCSYTISNLEITCIDCRITEKHDN